MECARNYMATKISWQEERIQFLCFNLKALESSLCNFEDSLQRNNRNMTDVSLVVEGNLSFHMTFPGGPHRSISILRGDNSFADDVDHLSLLGSSIPLGEEQNNNGNGETLIAEILRAEVSIERISAEISDKAANLSDLDAATNSALANFVSQYPKGNN
ncbi:unnamed protein product [Lasius platythorax]